MNMRSIKNHLMNKLLTIIFTVFSCCNILLFAQTVDKQESVITLKMIVFWSYQMIAA